MDQSCTDDKGCEPLLQVSVIIPTCNRPDMLRRTLASLVKQTASQNCFEVIVVDNGTSEETDKLVCLFQSSIANLRYVVEPSPGLHCARHYGLREATTEILIYVDDDIEAFPTWLEGIIETFKNHPEAVLVGGKSLPLFENAPPAWLESLWEQNEYGRVHGWLSLVDMGEQIRPIPAEYVYGCNFSIRRAVLQSCGGFHPDSMPWSLKHLRGDGETHVSNWISDHGLVAYYNPLASVYHQVPAERMTFKYLCKRAFLQAISYSYTVTRRMPTVRQRTGTTIKRIASVLFHQVICGEGGIRRHWLCLIYGLLWYQTKIFMNPQLLKWITKEDYFE